MSEPRHTATLRTGDATRRGVVVALGLAGFLFNFYIFYPGFLTSDAVDQYSQAMRHRYSDWHPPFMAVMWSALLRVIPDALGLLALISACLWGGIALFAYRLTSRVSYRGLLVFAIPLLPVVLNFSGMIWKDVIHATVWTLACGLLMVDSGESRRTGVVLRAVSALLILIGALVRPNSVFAAVPLLVWVLRTESPWKTAARVVLAVLFFVATTVSLSKLLDVGRDHAETSIQIYNLAGISHYLGENVLPGDWTVEESGKIAQECFTGHSWDNYIWGAAPPRSDCSFVNRKLREQHLWGSSELTHIWLRQIVSHPKEYLQGRLLNFKNFLWMPTQAESIKHASTIVNGEVQKAPNYSKATTAVIAYSTEPERLRMMAPAIFCFIAAACMTGLVLWWRRLSSSGRFTYAMLCSATVYALSYFPLGVASDMRYFYWSYISISVAALVIFLGAAGTRRVQGNLQSPAPRAVSLSCGVIVISLLIIALFPVA